MKFNFKKVVPVITGALLLGSTIGFATGVAGADATYPNSFADSVVVIGTASADSAAANEIAADLGKLTTAGEATVSGGHLMAKGSSVLNYNEDWQDIDPKIDDSDLPGLLTDGIFKDTKGNNDNEEAYTQSLTFVNGGNTLVFEADEDMADAQGAYLKLADGVQAYNYSLDFSTGPKFDNTSTTTLTNDFELTKLNILGDEWTITAISGTNNYPSKLTLMGGASSSSMKTGESKTLVMDGKTYEVEVTVYSTKAQFVINGESLTIDESSTDELADGTEVGVTEISTSSKETVADQVEFFLGARKLILESGQEVELNGEEVDGSRVWINNDATNLRLKEIQIAYSAEDDVWIKEGGSWEDPVFGKFKYVFASLNSVGEETIEIDTGADSGWMKVLNSAGKELKIDFWDNETAIFFGSKFSRANLTVLGETGTASQQGDLLVADGDYCRGNAIEKCEGIELLVVDSEGEARIYELSDVDPKDMKMTFKDKINDKNYEVDFVNGTNTLDIGLIGSMGLIVNQTINSTWTTGTQTLLNFTDINQYSGTPTGGFETSLEGAIHFRNSGDRIEMLLYNKTGIIEEFNMTVESASPQDMQVIAYGLSEEESGSDDYVGTDNINYGAWLKWDSEDKNDLVITYPGDEKSWADTYVSPVGAVVSGGGVVPVVRDGELGDLKTSKDLVVIGGPAINTIAAELLGLTFPTYGGDTDMFSADSAMVQLFEGTLTPGKVALLVAGYEAKDTAAAAKALVAENKFGDLTTTTASTYSYA